MKSLIVDPSPTAARIAAAALRRCGVETVLMARTRTEAEGLLAAEENGDLAILITERDLPDGDGLELLGMAGEGVLRGLTTLRSSRDDVLRAVETGIGVYLLKPLDPETIAERLAPLLADRFSDESADEAETGEPGDGNADGTGIEAGESEAGDGEPDRKAA